MQPNSWGQPSPSQGFAVDQRGTCLWKPLVKTHAALHCLLMANKSAVNCIAPSNSILQKVTMLSSGAGCSGDDRKRCGQQTVVASDAKARVIRSHALGSTAGRQRGIPQPNGQHCTFGWGLSELLTTLRSLRCRPLPEAGRRAGSGN